MFCPWADCAPSFELPGALSLSEKATRFDVQRKHHESHRPTLLSELIKTLHHTVLLMRKDVEFFRMLEVDLHDNICNKNHEIHTVCRSILFDFDKDIKTDAILSP